jgi:hypothetical protein
MLRMPIDFYANHPLSLSPNLPPPCQNRAITDTEDAVSERGPCGDAHGTSASSQRP